MTAPASPINPPTDPTAPTPFDRFTAHARAALSFAHGEATRLEHTRIGTAHLLLGLVGEPDGAAGRALRGLGLTLAAARASVETDAPAVHLGTITLPARTLDAHTKGTLRRAVDDAEAEGSTFVGTAHLLRALLQADDGAALALRRLDLSTERIMTALAHAEAEPSVAPTDRLTDEAPAETKDATDANLRLVLTLPAADLTRLLALARERDVTVSDLVREAVARVWLSETTEGNR